MSPDTTQSLPLVVDLDNTLIKTDSLIEQFLYAVKTSPLVALGMILALPFQGKLKFKAKLAALAPVDPVTLPYRDHILERIRRRRDLGQPTILASASHISTIQKVATHLNLFDHALGTSENNLKSHTKLHALEALLGHHAFEYMGDARADLPLWKACQHPVAINPSWLTTLMLKHHCPHAEIIRDRKSLPLTILKTLRAHQWVKNLLLFVPLIASHYFSSYEHWQAAFLAFFSFSLLASSVYILNDLFDLEADRKHTHKKNRPFAAGHLSIITGASLFVLCLTAAITIASFLPQIYWMLIGLYAGLNLFYTFIAKTIMVLDVVLLSLLYTLRIFAGGAATSIPVSHWLLAFSIFFFFGLALVKRFTEIIQLHGQAIEGRNYKMGDHIAVYTLGVTSSLISVLILVLYLYANNPTVSSLYHHPARLWCVTPILLYWLSRIWVLANRNEIHHDPIVFAITDKASWITGFLLLVVFLSAL